MVRVSSTFAAVLLLALDPLSVPVEAQQDYIFRDIDSVAKDL